jgi:hypothetical protein
LERPGVFNSLDIENHVSWDFAEGVHLPYSSQQEVKIYFKFYIICMYCININNIIDNFYFRDQFILSHHGKVSIFGICEEAFPRQV